MAWRKVRVACVVRGNFLKLSQNEQIRPVLLPTGSLPLIDDAPNHPVWGIGNGKGMNLLGQVMQVNPHKDTEDIDVYEMV